MTTSRRTTSTFRDSRTFASRRPARTLDAAEQLFQRSLAEEADFARAQAGLCQTRVERFLLERVPAHVAAAEEACARAQALDDTAFEVHEAVGSLRLVTGNAAEAELAYRRALAIVPESPDALIGLAAALADAGKAVEAERTFERAIAAQPRYAASHVEYGSFLFRQGRARDAIAPWQRATVLEPDSPSAFNNLGVAYLYAGNFEQAAEAFSRSLAIEPTRSGYSNTGMGFYYHGQFGKAAEMFRKATELTPSDHRPWGNLADALLFGGRRGRSRAGLCPRPGARRGGTRRQPEARHQPGPDGVLFKPAPARGPGPTVHRERPGRRGQRQ